MPPPFKNGQRRVQKHPEQEIAHLAHPPSVYRGQNPIRHGQPVFIRRVFIRMSYGPPEGEGLPRPDEQGMQFCGGELQVEHLVLLIDHIKACMGVIQRTARLKYLIGQTGC
ncbi:hypothetical protein D3C75_1016580 [compost metagenome]